MKYDLAYKTGRFYALKRVGVWRGVNQKDALNLKQKKRTKDFRRDMALQPELALPASRVAQPGRWQRGF